MTEHQDEKEASPDKGADPAGGADGSNQSPPPKSTPPANLFEEVIFGTLAIAALIIWGGTLQPLLRATYYTEVDYGGSKPQRIPNVLNRIIGTVVAFGAGICVGYPQWAAGVEWYQWLWHATATAAAFAILGWPLFHVTLGKWTLRFREHLWSYVNEDGKDPPYRYGREDEVGNPAWFSRLLMGVSFLADAAGGAYLLYWTALYVHAHQASWSWLGTLLGVVVMAVLGIISFAIVIGAFRLSFKLGLVVVILGGLIGYALGAPAMIVGLYHNLTGGDWGSWGYVPGVVAGLVFGGAVSGAAGFILYNFRVRAIALATAVSLTVVLAPTLNSLTGLVPLGPFTFLAPALPWLAYGVTVGLIEGFAFPLAHIVITHVFLKLANIFDLMDEVYSEKSGGYREFFLQVSAITGFVAASYFGEPVVGNLLGWTNPLTVYPVSVIASFVLIYLVGNAILNVWGSAVLGVIGAGVGAKYAFAFYAAHSWPYGIVGCWLAAVGTFIVLFAAVIPLLYVGLRKLIDGRITKMIRNELVQVYGEIVENLFGAAEKAYGDRTSFRKVEAVWTAFRLALIVLVGVGYGMWMLGFANWLAIGSACVLALTVYTLGGQFFLRFGIAPLSFVLAAGIGIAGGVLIHGGQPADWGIYRYGFSVVGGIAVAAVAFGGPLAWVYVIFRAIYQGAHGETWLLPICEGLYDPLWERARGFKDNFMQKYRYFQERFGSFRERFGETYARFQQKLNDRTNKK